ncbi:metastasis-suppressor KiSS-1 [Spea bombifrons]|uniref:metastasis-suppressor KiSS-1 n=1 Tax=Spea bombifrons TaxID=233779 RepID=UPI00234B23D9|nr:metastasis-suppressor KiSS-1 [Spea bombifrons]
MSVLSLLCLLVAVHLGESTPDGLDYTSKLTGEGRSLMLGHNQWLPCSDKMPATWKMEQTPILALLCRRKKLSPSNQLWSEDSPVPSRVSSAPDGAFLVEREKDLSTYNWNSFGLRYGKRQSGAVNSKIKFL